MSKARNPVSQQDFSEFAWCVHCERVQLTRQWLSRSWRCPSAGCAGTAVAARPWERVRELWLRYPEVPQVGERYSFSDPGGATR